MRYYGVVDVLILGSLLGVLVTVFRQAGFAAGFFLATLLGMAALLGHKFAYVQLLKAAGRKSDKP